MADLEKQSSRPTKGFSFESSSSQSTPRTICLYPPSPDSRSMADLEKQSPPPTKGFSFESSSSQATPGTSCLHPPVPVSVARTGALQYQRRKAWLTVVGSFLALYCSFGQMIAFGTFQSWYSSHELSYLSEFNISWIGSLQLCAFFFMGGPMGRIFDTYGPSPLLTAGTVLLVSSLVLTSVITQYYQYLLVQGVMFGLSVAMLFYASVSSVATHFDEYRATAIGITTAGSGLGGVIYPLMFRSLFSTVGFGWGVRVSAIQSAILGAAAILTVTTRPELVDKPPRSLIDTSLATDRRFLLLVVGSFFVCFGIFIPYTYISEFAQSLHIEAETAFYVLSIMNAGSVVGRVAPAWLSDKIGRFNLLCPSAFLSGLVCLLLWTFCDNFVALAAFAAIYGFLSGAFISVVTPCVAQISKTSEIGTRIGALYTFVSVPALIGAPIAGALVQAQNGSFIAAIMFAGWTMVVGSIFLLASKLSISRHLCHRV